MERKVTVQMEGMPQKETLFEIKSMPKQEFLNAVKETEQLDGAEKQLVQRRVDPFVYTHCRLTKCNVNGELVLKLDQFYPRVELGQDADGHKIVDGGSGSISKYKKRDAEWTFFEGIDYD